MKKFKTKDIYKTKSYQTETNTAKDILNGLYRIMNKKEDIMNKREELLRIANEFVNGAMAGYAACAYEMNQDKHPMDDEGKKITFDDCAWGNSEYGDIHMDDYDDSETFMFHGYFPRKHDDELPDEFSDDFDMKYPCYDKLSGLYFYSNIKSINFVLDTLNKTLRDVGFVSVRNFYHALGLKPDRPTGGLGWRIEKNDHIDVSFSSRLEPDGNPCLVIDLKPSKTSWGEE